MYETCRLFRGSSNGLLASFIPPSSLETLPSTCLGPCDAQWDSIVAFVLGRVGKNGFKDLSLPCGETFDENPSGIRYDTKQRWWGSPVASGR